MKHNFKRFLSLLLALVMVLGMFPMTHAHAEGEAAPAVYQVTEVVDGGEYAFTYAGMRAAYNRVKDNNRLDAGNISLDDIKNNAGYRWKLEAVDSDGNGEIEGYRIKGVGNPQYLVLHEGTAALVDNDADAQVFTFEYTDAGFMIHDKNVADSYFNNFANGGNIAGYSGGTGIKVYRYEAEHIHNYVDAPAVEPTLTSTGLTAGTVCVCGAVGTGRETIPMVHYNDGIVPLEKLTATAGSADPDGGTYPNDGGAGYAIDDNLDTMWHTNYSGDNDTYGANIPENRWIDFAIEGNYDVTGLRYIARNSGGKILQYVIQASYDGETYVDVATGTWENNANWEEVKFEQPLVQVKNVRLKAVTHQGEHATAKEIRLVGKVHLSDEHKHTEVIIPGVEATFSTAGKTAGKKCSECGEILEPQVIIPAGYNVGIVPKEHIVVTTGSAQALSDSNKTEGPGEFVLDDEFGTMWHTDWNGTAEANLWIDFKLTQPYEVTSLRYLPRNPVNFGVIFQYKILVSYDGVNYIEVASGTWDENTEWKIAEFNAVGAKNIRLFAVTSKSDHRLFASAAEIRLVGDTTDHEHEFTSTVTAPTCTTAGYTTYTCACNYSYTANATEALGHDYESSVVQEGSCTEAKITENVCANCGDRYQDVVGAPGHSFTNYEYDENATCVADGTKTAVCDNCDATDTLTAEGTKLDHDWVELPDYDPATCEEAGTRYYECVNGCEGTKEESIPATGHTEGEPVIEGNETVVYCTVCDAELSRTTNECEHEYEYECSTNCKICGEKTRPEVDHVSTSKYDCVAGKCQYCEKDMPATAEHNSTSEYACVAGTCEICGMDMPATVDHTPNADDGDCLTPVTCSVCNTVTTPGKENHTFNDGEVTTPATCTEDGVKTYTCTVCGTTSTEIIPATHKEIIHAKANEPSCEVPGNLEYWGCNICNGRWLDEELTKSTTIAEIVIPATGHVNTSLIGAKEATCGAEGYTGDLVCDKCGVTVTPGTAIPATSKHTYVESDRVEPTYTTEGYVAYKCSACDDEYTDHLDVKAKLKIVGATMTLGNSLDMNFLVKKADLVEGAYAVITKTFADGREDVVVNTAVWTDYADNDGLQYVKLSDLSAKEMTDTITVVVYDAEGNAISEVWTDSMKDYAMRLIAQQEAAKASNQEYLTFAVDMLNYGAAAQQIFNYNTENLANADLTDAQKAYATADITIENKQVKDDKIVGATLLLQNSIQLNFIYKTSDIAEGMYAVATYTNHRGVEKTVEISYDQFGKMDKAGVYTYIPVADSAMADCRQMITLTVYNEDGTVFSTVTDSVESYCARISSSDALYTEIMKLADSAYALFH